MKVSPPFAETTKNRTRFQIFLWWELRRFIYNLLMLISIYVGLKIVGINIASVEPGSGAFFIFICFVVIALAANGFYTLGWIIELFRKHNERFAPRAFKFILFTTLLFIFIFAGALRYYFT